MVFRFSLTDFVDHGCLKDIPLYDIAWVKNYLV